MRRRDVYGVDIGGRRIAIAGPDYQLAALKLPNPKTGMWRWTGPSEVSLLAGFVAAVVPPDATLWVEQPFAQHGARQNIGTVARLGMTAGAVFGVHYGVGYLIDQAVWKAALLGNGHSDKQQIREWLWANDPASAEACGGDQDLIDACCLRAYGLGVAEGRLESPWPVQ